MGLGAVRGNKRNAILIAMAFTALTGCSGGTSVVNNPSPPSPLSSLANVFVMQGTNSILQFMPSAPGSNTPVTTITVASPTNVESFAADTSGNLYLGATVPNSAAEILVYSPSSGNYTLSRVITGSSQSFSSPYQIALDNGGGLYVLDNVCSCVVIFDSTASGTAVPLRNIYGYDTQINNPVAMAVDAANNIYVANHLGKYPDAPSPDGAQVEVFGPDSDGDAAPSQIITGSSTDPFSPITGIAVDAASDVFVNFGPRIVEFSAPPKGAFAAQRNIIPPAPEAQSSAMQVDVSGNLFVLWFAGTTLTPRISVYPKTAVGSTTPEAPYTTGVWTATPVTAQFALK